MRKEHCFTFLDHCDREMAARMELQDGFLLYVEYFNGVEWVDIDTSQLTEEDIHTGWKEGVLL